MRALPVLFVHVFGIIRTANDNGFPNNVSAWSYHEGGVFLETGINVVSFRSIDLLLVFSFVTTVLYVLRLRFHISFSLTSSSSSSSSSSSALQPGAGFGLLYKLIPLLSISS